MRKIQYSILILLPILLFYCQAAFTQSTKTNSSDNELTLYVMPTLMPLNWDSPSSLYKSMKNCYFKTIGVKDNYLLGHVVIKLRTPLLNKPLVTGQTAASAVEKVDLVLKDKVGFGILGTPLKGKLESEEHINHRLNIYAERKKLSFIKYKINEKAAQRIIEFIRKFSQKMNEKYAPCDFYGGAFWPLYNKEGASCSSFGIALLELINALNDEAKDWKLTKKIPMKLIGGETNNNKKIKNQTILKTNKWYEGDGIKNIDFYEYNVYEPSIMYDWILAKTTQNDSKYKTFTENNIAGVIVDVSHIDLFESSDFFKQRTEADIFIDHYIKTKVEINSETN